MKCPKCGLINTPTATRCDCGFGFVDGSVVPPVKPAPPGETLRKIGCSLGVLGMLASILLRTIAAGQGSFRLPAGVLGDLLVFAAFIGFAIWIIGTIRRNRARVGS